MLEELRKQVDQVDAELIKLLEKRMGLSVLIAQEKKASGMEIHQKTREIEILDRAKLLGDSAGLSDTFVTDLYSLILAESRRIQGLS